MRNALLIDPLCPASKHLVIEVRLRRPASAPKGELELVVFASSQTYSRLRIFLTESKFTIAGPRTMTPKASFGEHRIFESFANLFDDFPRIRLEIRFREFKADPSVPDDTFCLECSCTQFYAYDMHRRKLLEVKMNHLARLHA